MNMVIYIVGGIVATWRFRITKFVPFQYPRRPSWNSSYNISSKTLSDWANFMGGITVTQRLRIAKTVRFRYPRWNLSWNSLNDISPKPCQIELKLSGRHCGFMDIQKCYKSIRSDIEDSRKLFKRHLLHWWEALERHRDSELLYRSVPYPSWLPWRPSWNSPPNRIGLSRNLIGGMEAT